TPTSFPVTSAPASGRRSSRTSKPRSAASAASSSGPISATTRRAARSRRRATGRPPIPSGCSAPTTRSPRTASAPRSRTRRRWAERRRPVGDIASSDERELSDGGVVGLPARGGGLEGALHSGRGVEEPEEMRAGQHQEERGVERPDGGSSADVLEQRDLAE